VRGGRPFSEESELWRSIARGSQTDKQARRKRGLHGCSKTIPIDLTTHVGSDYLNAASRAQSAWNNAGVGIAVSHSTYYGNKLFTGLYGYEWYGAYHVRYLGGSTYHQTTGFYIQVNTMLCDALSTYAKQSVVGHELGHAVGLENCSSVALMNTNRNRDSVYYPMWDDRMGAIASWSR
jgi:hypothetical protein